MRSRRALVAYAQRAWSVVLPTLGVAGLVIVVATLPIPRADASWSAATRALALLVFTWIVLGAARPRSAGATRAAPVAASATARALTAAAVMTLAALSTAASGVVHARMFAPILVAAAVEEVLFRYLLPAHLERAMLRCTSPTLARYVAAVSAQLGFAFSHLVLIGGLASLSNVSLGSRLFAGGLLLASIRLLAGLPASIAVHGIGNAIVLGATPSLHQPLGRLGLLSLVVAALTHVALSVRTLAPPRHPRTR